MENVKKATTEIIETGYNKEIVKERLEGLLIYVAFAFTGEMQNQLKEFIYDSFKAYLNN